MRVWFIWKSMMSRTILTVMAIKLIDNNHFIFPKISKANLTSKLKGILFQRPGLKHRLMSSSPLSRKLESPVSLAINCRHWTRRDMSRYLPKTLARLAISSNPTIRTVLIRLVRELNWPLWAHPITKQATQNWSKRVGFRLVISHKTKVISQYNYFNAILTIISKIMILFHQNKTWCRLNRL